ncbi:MAG: hypothetical protein AAF790_14180 [Planctomycetota bacterium]
MGKRMGRQQKQLLITGGIVGLVGVAVVGVAISQLAGRKAAPAAAAEAPAAVAGQSRGGNAGVVRPERAGDAGKPRAKPPADRAEDAISKPDGPQLVEDDGRTLWQPPTEGEPLSLAGLPPGVRLVASIRPRAMQATADGRITHNRIAAVYQGMLQQIAAAAGVDPAEAERVTLAVRPGTRPGEMDVTCVADFAAAPPSESPEGERAPPQTLATRGGWAVVRVAPNRVAAARPETAREITASGGLAPPLTREMEQLVEASDSSRHASLLVAPSSLLTGGKSILSGGVAALRGPLLDQLPEDVRGLLLGVHFTDAGFYWEARAASTVETTATQLGAMLDGRMASWPSALQLSVLDLNPDPHGRRIVANLPAMVRLMAEYTRWGVEGRQAVLNGYLPPAAGHNLLMAADLMLAQQSAGAGGTAALAATPAPPTSAADRLKQTATVSFPRDTLETALRLLAEEIGVPVVIRGGDLQLEGITKNQSFGMNAQRQPAEAVLVEILRLANPDKTAAGPADPKQKLVYVVRADATGKETIYVTTRAAAAKRGEVLPSVFQP